MLIQLLILFCIVLYLSVGIAWSLLLWEKETILTTLFWPLVIIFLVVKAVVSGSDHLAKKLKEFVEDLRD